MSDRPHFAAAAFVLVAGILIASVGLVMGEFRFEDKNTYVAIFSSVNGLHEGDEVRAAGIGVGKVEDIELRDDDVVAVRFSAAADIPVYEGSRAAVRYKSLTGTKFLGLSRGDGPADLLADGHELPLDQTDPGLDLDAVFNSFKPLVQGLSPDQINQLSGSIIEVFQGQSSAIESLLANLGQLTSTLADREDVIEAMITNFQAVLSTVDSRKDELASIVRNVQTLVHGLAEDRYRIVDSISAVSDLALEGSALIAAIRPPLRDALAGTDEFTDAFNSDLDAVDYYLKAMPVAIDAISRVGAYGSFYNIYICGLTVRLDAPGGGFTQTPTMYDDAPRCQYPDGEQ